MPQIAKPTTGSGFSGGLYTKLSSGQYQPISDASGNMLQTSMVTPATIATTSNTDQYIIAPFAATVESILFSATAALAANDTNYITFSVTNLGQAGAGSTAIIAATDANTTKATGGTAIAANTLRTLTLSSTAANLIVAAGDRLLVRAAATGTLANTVTFPTYAIKFSPII